MANEIDIEALPEFQTNAKAAMVLARFKIPYLSDPSTATSVGSLGRAYCFYEEYKTAACVLNFGVNSIPSDHKALKARADLLSRCPDKAFRDGEAAIRDATRALDLARDDGWFDGRSFEECAYLETLAAGYVLIGDRKSATEILLKAIDVAKTNGLKNRLKESLAKVESGKLLVYRHWRGRKSRIR